jgi:hypothetical protein
VARGTKRASGAANSRISEEGEGVDDAGDGGVRAGADVGGGAGDGAGGGHAAEEGRDDVGDALGDEFHVGVVAVAGHAVRNYCGKKTFDGGEHGDGEGGGEQRQDVDAVEVGRAKWGKPRGDAAELGADGLDRRWKDGGRAAVARTRATMAPGMRRVSAYGK